MKNIKQILAHNKILYALCDDGVWLIRDHINPKWEKLQIIPENKDCDDIARIKESAKHRDVMQFCIDAKKSYVEKLEEQVKVLKKTEVELNSCIDIYHSALEESEENSELEAEALRKEIGVLVSRNSELETSNKKLMDLTDFFDEISR